MKTSLTTFENDLKEWLLDLLHGQWRVLGVPFAVPAVPENELIDPEALIWCTLEFFPSEPRLREGSLNWLHKYDQHILRPRVRKLIDPDVDPRAAIWAILDPAWRNKPVRPASGCYGSESGAQLAEIEKELQSTSRQAEERHQPGTPAQIPATAMLKARSVLGPDARHLLLLYLLANPGGARLKAAASWSGQSYRNLAHVATQWQWNVIVFNHGFCRLLDPPPWRQILGLDDSDLILINWPVLFNACIELLRGLEKARRKSIPADGLVVRSLVHKALVAVDEDVVESHTARSPTVDHLRDLLRAGVVGHRNSEIGPSPAQRH